MKDLKKAFVYIEKDLIDSNGEMHSTVNSLIEIYSMVTGSNNITLRKVNKNSYGLIICICINI